MVGAGPGGSNAAAVALRAGLRVAQIDRERFPRVKPCAGGMTMKTFRALRLEWAPWVRATWSAVEFNLWHGTRNQLLHRTRPVVRLVARPEFDNALVEQNREHPDFELFSGERVLDAQFDGAFTIRTAARSLRAPQLVAADGAYSTLNRIFRVAQPRAHAVAIEVNVPKEAVDVDRELTMCFDFGAVEAGYGWVFPKDDHWSVGLYTYRRGLSALRDRLLGYLAAKQLMPRDRSMLQFEAHQVPVGGYRLAHIAAPLYVVGDAGGFADALTGEGIYHAVESGRIAGEVAAAVHQGTEAHGSSRYHRRLWGSVLPDTFLTYHASRHFYRHLRSGTRALAAPGVWRALVEGYADSATFAKTVALAPRYITRSLAHRTVTRETSAA